MALHLRPLLQLQSSTGHYTLYFESRHLNRKDGESGGKVTKAEAGKRRGLVGAIEVAGMDLADGNVTLAQRLAKGLRQRLAAVVEIALRGYVLRMARVGVRLIGKRRAVPRDDDVAAGS